MFSFLRPSLLHAFRCYASTPIIGIDLGTTNSCVAICEGSSATVTVLENSSGSRITPSCVAFLPDGSVLVGESARRRRVVDPKNVMVSTKRLIGRTFGDPVVQKEMILCGYDIVPSTETVEGSGSGGVSDLSFSSYPAWVRPDCWEESMSPSQVASYVLASLREVASEYLGPDVDVVDAVVTVPAYFDNSQKQATKDAGTIAGLNVRRIINEPTAAALAFGIDASRFSDDARRTGTDQTGVVAVFDLGGGTFDISILEIGVEAESGANVFSVLATNGDTHLGGEDFDQVISELLLREFRQTTGIDLYEDLGAIQRIREESENVKKRLDHMDVTTVSLPFLAMQDGTPVNFETEILRSSVEDAVWPLVERAIQPCRMAMSDAGLSRRDIDEVLLVGGMTRMPLVQEVCLNVFGRLANKRVNPDECVAIGAAIQGAILNRDLESVMLVDVTPLSLGIETLGDVLATIIPRNTPIPNRMSKRFTTSEDNQTTVTVKIYQGERSIASANRFLGSFVLDGIPAAPKGIASILVDFVIDANGILNVSAEDAAAKMRKTITVQSSGGLSQAQIDQMMAEAEQFREEDIRIRAANNARLEASSMVEGTYDSLRVLQTVLDPKKADEIRALVREVELAIKRGNDEELILAVENLQPFHAELWSDAYSFRIGGG